MKKSSLFLIALALLCACKKHNSNNTPTYDSNVHPYFKDVHMQEKQISGTLASFQHALGYWPSKGDPNTQIMVASRGFEELNDARGFRIASINKTSGQVNWVKSYDLNDSYSIQIITCATMDNDGNVWVAGHSFTGIESASLFLVKLDRSGNIVWSNGFSNNSGWRAYSLTTLRNGDLALLAKSGGGLKVFRVSPAGQALWSTTLGYTYGGIDDDFYTKPNLLSPESHALAETSDGSIFFATSSNGSVSGVGGSDRLYKLDAGGKLQFARVYKLDGNTSVVRPVQLINAGDDQLLMADQAFSSPLAPNPYFALLAPNGDVRTSRGRSSTAGGAWLYQINQVNWYQGNLYLSTCGNRDLCTYVIDGSLNLKSANKTIYVFDIGTDRGGMSLFDATDRALYYVCNFGGNFGESNGFEVVRNDAAGKPCIDTYVNPPSTLQLENNHFSVTDDKIDTVVYGAVFAFTPLTWRPNPVSVIQVEAVCGQ
ncbi:MAG: hypothetical protein JST68_21435 [Bacteroidetes bacterium]|nr:hypothetical protein [Bacteroidota bacterium]